MRKSSRLLLLNRPRAVSSPPAPLVMPAGASLLAGIWQVDGYTGDCCTVRRASDAATANIGFGADYAIDEAAMITHQDVSNLTYTQFNDQSGNGLHPAQATVNNQPSYFDYRKRRGNVGASTLGTRWFDFPAGLSIDRQNCTIISVHAAQVSLPTNAVFQLGTGTTNRLAYNNFSNGNSGVRGSGAHLPSGIVEPTQPIVVTVTGSASATRVRINGVNGTETAADTSVSMAGGFWGKAGDASTAFQGNMYFIGIYPRVLDESEIADAEARLYAKATAWANAGKNALFDGGSIVEGVGGEGLSISECWERDYATEQVRIRNIGKAGDAAADRLSQINNNLLRFVNYSSRYNTVFMNMGSNDLLGATTAADAYASVIQYIERAKSMGCRIVASTIAARDGDATYQTKRTDFNNLLIADMGEADYLLRADLTFTDPTNTTWYDADEVHFTRVGYAKWAEILDPNLSAALASAQPLPAALPSTTAASLTNLAFWHDGSDIANFGLFGNRITQWNDSSGNGNHATQTTQSRQPGFYGAVQNLRSGVNFNGDDDGFDMPAGSLGIGAGANTLIAVWRPLNLGDASQRIVGGVNGSAGFRYGIVQTATEVQFSNFFSASTAASIAYARANEVVIAGFTRSGTNLTPFLNGNAGTAITNAANVTCAQIIIGANSAYNATRLNGYGCEIIAYSEAKSNSDLNTIGSALAEKWDGNWTGL